MTAIDPSTIYSATASEWFINPRLYQIPYSDPNILVGVTSMKQCSSVMASNNSSPKEIEE